MAKYGISKYGRSKYGRYDIQIPTDKPLSQITRYRMRTIDSSKRQGRFIVSTNISFPADAPVKLRLKANDGRWVRMQSVILPGAPGQVRVCTVSAGEKSAWVQSVTGTMTQVSRKEE